MKKLLILTAVFASLLTCFIACSDDNVGEEIPGVGPDLISIYDITGFLSFDDNANKYALDVHNVYNTAGKTEKYLLDSLSKDKVYIEPRFTVFEDQLEEFVGSEITTTITHDEVRYFFLHGMLPLPGRINAATVKSAQRLFADDTPEIFPEAYVTIPSSRSSSLLPGHYEVVNVFVHVLRKIDGTGLNKETVTWNVIGALNDYNNITSATQIKFQSVGSEYIDYLTDDMIKNLDIRYNETERNKIFSINSHSDALDVYVLRYWNKEYPDGTLGGKAAGIPSTAFILHPDCYKIYSHVPAHEAGHCLGLFHTHYGTAEEGGIPEFVDGTNSEDAGDFVKDTPADPNAWIGGEYDSSKKLRDGHGDLYSPDPTNIMSYSRNSIQRFSSGQADRMHYFLTTNTTVSAMATRPISSSGTQFSGTGTLHFSERTKTLTFPVETENEIVTWTISQRSGGYNATFQASPQVSTKTGKSITIEHNSQADYYEISASIIAPSGGERKTVWKATAGVPSAAVGTLSWTSGNGTTGSFPGYSPTLVLSNFDTSLDLRYTDLANPIYRSGITYRVYTSAGGVYESRDNFAISEMDCSRGYIEVQAVDDCCGADGIRWQINCQTRWDTFSLDMKDGQLTIGVKAATAKVSAAEQVVKRNLIIKSIKLTTPEGREIMGRVLDTPQRTMSLSTAGMKKGQYQIEITDVDGNVHRGRFGI